MQHSVVFAGFGGQGLLFCGQVLALAAMREGREVSWMPSYGPEMRGGTASCTVIVADRPIGSPLVDAADTVVALNPPSLARFEGLLAPGGLIVVNSSLVEAEVSRQDLEALAVPCSALATEAGDVRLVSIVALGALVTRRPIVDVETISAALTELVGAKHPELLAANVRAFELGQAAARAEPIAA